MYVRTRPADTPPPLLHVPVGLCLLITSVFRPKTLVVEAGADLEEMDGSGDGHGAYEGVGEGIGPESVPVNMQTGKA